MSENTIPAKKKWVNKNIVKTGVPQFSCVDSYVEKMDRTKHVGVDEETYTALELILEEYDDSASMSLIAGDILSEAISNGWQPYPKPCDFKLNFKNLSHDLTVSITKSAETKMQKLAEASGVKIPDYIRLAFCWKLVMGKEYTEKPY